MIQSIYRRGQKQVTCDNCGDGFEAESFDDARSEMKETGWVTRNVDGKVVHYCPECAAAK